MEVKLFEVRDQATFMPVMAVKLDPRNEAERYLLARSGYGLTAEDMRYYILVSRLQGGQGNQSCDPYDGGSSTMQCAHKYIIKEWANLTSGDVVDVEFIMDVTAAPKKSEAITAAF